MDWLAKATWIGSSGSNVSLDRLKQLGIRVPYVSPKDAGAAGLIAGIRQRGMTPGLYSDPHWYGLQSSPLRYRQQLDADCARLLRADEPLIVDLEQVAAVVPGTEVPDPKEYVRRLVNGFPGNRGLVGSGRLDMPTGTQADRPLAYTNEPFKDGSVVPIDVLAAADMHWYPQLYYGDMTPADPAAVVLEILRWCESLGLEGFTDNVHPFYDGARWALDQRDGAWFTAERLPGVFDTPRLLAAVGLTRGSRVNWTKAYLRDVYTERRAG